MRFIMLLKSDDLAETGAPPDEKVLTEMGNYSQALMDAGVLLSGEGLHASAQGARIRIQNGKTTISDGPFAETKEVVAGFYVLNTKSKAEAIEWAKRIPAPEGRVELRPLYELEDFAVDGAEKPEGWRDLEAATRQSPPPAPGPEHGARYVSFIKADKNTEAAMMPSEKLMSEMGALMQEMAQKNLVTAGEGLKPTSEGARILFSGKQRSVIDGPFTETKEIIAGYTLYRSKSKAEAIEWARRCLQIHIDGTGIDAGEIEVRRVHELEDIAVTANEKENGWREQEKRLRERLV